MSWSIPTITVPHDLHGVMEEIEPILREAAGDVNTRPAEEAKSIDLAIRCAVRILHETPDEGDGFLVDLSGHANPGHQGDPKDSMTVRITQR